MVENGDAELVLHRHDRLLEAAFLPGARGALLALDRVGVDIVARETVLGGDQVGADALRREVGFHRDFRVRRPGAAIRAHRHAAHRFDAAADGHVGFAGHHFRCGDVAGFKARGAKAIDLHAGCRFGVVGVQHRDAGDVRALLADRRNAAEDHIVDLRRVEIVAVVDRFQHLRRQLQRGDLVQEPMTCLCRAACEPRRRYRLRPLGPPCGTRVVSGGCFDQTLSTVIPDVLCAIRNPFIVVFMPGYGPRLFA